MGSRGTPNVWQLFLPQSYAVPRLERAGLYGFRRSAALIRGEGRVRSLCARVIDAPGGGPEPGTHQFRGEPNPYRLPAAGGTGFRASTSEQTHATDIAQHAGLHRRYP